MRVLAEGEGRKGRRGEAKGTLRRLDKLLEPVRQAIWLAMVRSAGPEYFPALAVYWFAGFGEARRKCNPMLGREIGAIP
jgi:hypothetical protein